MQHVLAVLKSPIAMPADAPEWWRFLPCGEILVMGEKKPLLLDDLAAAMIIAYFKSLGRDMVIDYEHQTLKDVQAPAAGWIKAFDWRGADGLWVQTEWTARAAAYIAAKEYRYYSPVMLSRPSDGRIAAVLNAALTNDPRTRNIAAIAAKMDLEAINFQPKETAMWKKLIKILKLKDDADQAAVESAVEAVVAKNGELTSQLAQAGGVNVVACKGVLDVLGLAADASETAVIAKIDGLKVGGTAAEDLARQVADLRQKINGMEAGDLVATALKNGQTSPDELEKWGNELAKKDPEQFKKIVCSRAVGSVIPVGKTHVVKDSAADAQVDDAVLTVAKLMGNDPEDVKKYAK